MLKNKSVNSKTEDASRVPHRLWKSLAVTVISATVQCTLLHGQTAPPLILQIETEHNVNYFPYVSVYTRLASDPNRTAAVPPRFFAQSIEVGDIVSVNGQPAQGSWVSRWTTLPFFEPAFVMSDPTGLVRVEDSHFEIFQPDGTRIGAIITTSFIPAACMPPTLASTRREVVIVGGTGPFVGARGQGNRTAPSRLASMTEDPLAVTLNGQPSEVINELRWPGLVGTYQTPAAMEATNE